MSKSPYFPDHIDSSPRAVEYHAIGNNYRRLPSIPPTHEMNIIISKPTIPKDDDFFDIPESAYMSPPASINRTPMYKTLIERQRNEMIMRQNQKINQFPNSPMIRRNTNRLLDMTLAPIIPSYFDKLIFWLRVAMIISFALIFVIPSLVFAFIFSLIALLVIKKRKSSFKTSNRLAPLMPKL